MYKLTERDNTVIELSKLRFLESMLGNPPEDYKTKNYKLELRLHSLDYDLWFRMVQNEIVRVNRLLEG